MKRYQYVEEEVDVPEDLNGFKDWEFSSGSTTGEDFNVFSRKFKAHIGKSLPVGAILVNFRSGHYDLSGFVQRGEKYVYFATSDVRHFPGNWHDDILVRTAQSDIDYTGGRNCSTTLETFAEDVEKLLGGEWLFPRLPM